MAPGVSSLNLATAVAVTLYAWRLGGARTERVGLPATPGTR
jgi:tRNA C32,U32 (ribose-2'-O)-methylase TrmJ